MGPLTFWEGLLRWLSGKQSSCQAGDVDSIPGPGRCPGEGNGNPLQYSCLEHPMDRGIWRAIVHGVTKELNISSSRLWDGPHFVCGIYISLNKPSFTLLWLILKFLCKAKNPHWVTISGTCLRPGMVLPTTGLVLKLWTGSFSPYLSVQCLSHTAATSFVPQHGDDHIALLTKNLTKSNSFACACIWLAANNNCIAYISMLYPALIFP